MKKYDLLRSGDSIIRVLEIQDNRVLIIDCIKRTMPMWNDISKVESYTICADEELREVTGIKVSSLDNLDPRQRKTMYNRYTMISSILAVVSSFVYLLRPDGFKYFVRPRPSYRIELTGMSLSKSIGASNMDSR